MNVTILPPANPASPSAPASAASPGGLAAPADSGRKVRLGDALLQDGLITEEQLRQALELQKKHGKRLGTILVEMHLVTENEIAQVLSRQLRIPFVDLGNYLVDPIIARLVPEHLARRHQLVPINKVGNKLTVAMVDPLNIIAIDDVAIITGLMVKPVVGTPTGVAKAQQEAHGEGTLTERLIDDITTMSKDAEDPANLDLSQDFDENDAPIIRLCHLVIAQAVQSGASDIHIEPHEKDLRVRYRQDGMLQTVMQPPKKAAAAIASRIKIMASLNIAEKRLPQDGRIKLKVHQRNIDLRVSIIPVMWGEKIVMRILDQSSLKVKLEDLGFEPGTLARFKAGIAAPYGIVLVTGPTGSGKTTTLYSALATLNTAERNVLTAEDPVEYMLPGINQLQCRSEIGLTFAGALRSFLRQDPNIIMVGEIRDFETAEIAIKASMTGHLVLSTLHTNDAPGTIGRLTNMGIEPFMITTSVLLVQAQRLVRRICKECKTEIKPRAEQLAQLGITPELLRRLDLPHLNERNLLFYRGKGCEACNNAGLRGRVGVYEVLAMTERLRELILNGGSTDDIRRQAVEDGMLSLRESALRKALLGQTTIEEVVRVTLGEH
ncbi:MAG: type IV-A pilus assembly ATPase PilB [Candidatus Riflebacteria bacterium]|nr:type IV-A pilus assembly ATPase PilB [Candidatus Riflebacteria bacterium]